MTPLNYTTFNASGSSSSKLDFDEMRALIDKYRARKAASDSGMYFAALTVKCHVCRRTARYDESSNTIWVCDRMYAALKEQIPESVELRGMSLCDPSSRLSGINVRLYEEPCK